MVSLLPSRKIIAGTLKVCVGLGLLAVLFWQAHSKGVGDLLVHVHPGLSILALGTLILAVALNAIRWQAVMARLGVFVGPATTLTGTFEGMFFNLFLPSSVGGDAVRAYRAFDRGADGPLVVESALIDRAIGLWGVGVTLLIATPFAVAATSTASYSVVTALSGLIVVGGVSVALLGKLVEPERFRSWRRPIADVVRNYSCVLLGKPFIVAIVPALAASSALTCATMWLAARSLGLNLTFWDAVVVLQASTLAALIPISVGGWGVREGMTMVLLTASGVPADGAIAVSLLFGIALAAVGAIGAVVWLCSPYRGLVRFSEMRRKSTKNESDILSDAKSE